MRVTDYPANDWHLYFEGTVCQTEDEGRLIQLRSIDEEEETAYSCDLENEAAGWHYRSLRDLIPWWPQMGAVNVVDSTGELHAVWVQRQARRISRRSISESSITVNPAAYNRPRAYSTQSLMRALRDPRHMSYGEAMAMFASGKVAPLAMSYNIVLSPQGRIYVGDKLAGRLVKGEFRPIIDNCLIGAQARKYLTREGVIC